MIENKLISVIVPIYNVPEPMLRRCIESILKQTYHFLEIILVNDNSPDNSLNIIKQYSERDERIIIIDKIINEGVSAARNDGLSIAKGNYVSFIDADDYIADARLAALLKIADENYADIVVTSLQRVTEDGYRLFSGLSPNRVFNLKNKNDRIEALAHISYYVPTKLFKAVLLKGIRFPKLIIGEDLVFSINCFLKAERMITSGDISYYYVQRNQSTLRKEITFEYVESQIIARKMVKDLFESFNFMDIYLNYFWKTVYQETTLLCGMIAKIKNRQKRFEYFKYLKKKYYSILATLVPEKNIYDLFYKILFNTTNNPKLFYYCSYFIYRRPTDLLKDRLTKIINRVRTKNEYVE